MNHDFPVRKLFSQLRKDDLLPCILFRGARRQCNEDILALDRLPYNLVTNEKEDELKQSVLSFIEKYQVPPEVIYEHDHFQALVRHGVGAHHAGQLLIWRLLLEEMMAAGAMRMMIATGTVAAGVDFPARSVIITAHSKRGSDGFNIITSAEFQQMSGRAGRRGKDAVGVCIIAPNPYCDARVIHEIAQKPPEPLTSSYFASPSTALNLLKFRNVDDLHFTVERSLGSFLDKRDADEIRKDAEARNEIFLKEADLLSVVERRRREKRIRRMFREADEMEAKQAVLLRESLTGLEALGYIEGGALTPKGSWAAGLCTNLVLELGEAIEDGIFDGLSYRHLAGLVASISGDSYRHYFSIQNNPIPKESFDALQKVCERVNANYTSPLKGPSEVVPDAALTVLLWLESPSWSEFSSLLRLAGVAEGDISRLVSQTAENLNQITHLSVTHPLLAVTAAEARMKLLRPPLSDSLAVGE